MRRRASAVSGVIIACALLFGLGGCKGTDSGQSHTQDPVTVPAPQKSTTTPVPHNPVTVSAAFNTPSVWYASDEAPSANVPIEALFVFDGKGNVTTYNVKKAFTYGDVEDLPDEAIVARAKKADRDYFNHWKHAEEVSLLAQDEEEFSEKYGRHGQTRNEALNNLKNLKYQAPQPDSFIVRRKVEDGGNATVGEKLFTAQDYVVPERYLPNYGEYQGSSIELSFTTNDSAKLFSVGDKYFGGYANKDGWDLYTKVDRNHGGFLLDEDESVPEESDVRLPDLCGGASRQEEPTEAPRLPDPCGCGSHDEESSQMPRLPNTCGVDS